MQDLEVVNIKEQDNKKKKIWTFSEEIGWVLNLESNATENCFEWFSFSQEATTHLLDIIHM